MATSVFAKIDMIFFADLTDRAIAGVSTVRSYITSTVTKLIANGSTGMSSTVIRGPTILNGQFHEMVVEIRPSRPKLMVGNPFPYKNLLSQTYVVYSSASM
jgi:hypothetical protein